MYTVESAKSVLNTVCIYILYFSTEHVFYVLFWRQLESTWILFNKGKSEALTNEHAGFLMGQGLNGHVTKLATLNIHNYLIKVCIS